MRTCTLTSDFHHQDCMFCGERMLPLFLDDRETLFCDHCEKESDHLVKVSFNGQFFALHFFEGKEKVEITFCDDSTEIDIISFSKHPKWRGTTQTTTVHRGYDGELDLTPTNCREEVQRILKLEIFK